MFTSSRSFFIRSPCNPLCLDLLMWSVANRAQLFRKVKLLDSGHVAAAMPIAKNDIVCYIPGSQIMSIDKLKEDAYTSSNLQLFSSSGGEDNNSSSDNGLNLSISNVGRELKPWWPGVTKGHFALLCLMTTLKMNVDGKGGGHAAHLNLLMSQEDVLLESELVDNAAEAIDSKEFEIAVDPVLKATHRDIDEIRREMLDCFVSFERRSLVLFQQQQQMTNGDDGNIDEQQQQQQDSYFGLPSFKNSQFVQAAAAGEDNGAVRGLVPIIDLCTHDSQNPTCTIGFPDATICQWLAMERGVKAPSQDAVLLQAIRDIREDELLTVNRGLMMGLSGGDEGEVESDGSDQNNSNSSSGNSDNNSSQQQQTASEFEKWFGHRY